MADRPKPPPGIRHWWGRRSTFTKWAIGLVLFVFVGIPLLSAIFAGGGDDKEAAAPPPPAVEQPPPPPPQPPPPAGPPGDNIRARSTKFVRTMRICQFGVSTARSQAISGQVSLLDLADTVHSAQSICDGVQDRLRDQDTEHFDDQALIGQVAVDEWGQGLDDLADYIDDQAPSKLLNARDHLNQGDSAAAEAVREINKRRASFDVKPLR